MYNRIYPVRYYFYPALEHAFIESANQTQFLSILKNQKQNETENQLYIQIPFCKDLCSFCPFQTNVTTDGDTLSRYTASIIKEMKMLSELPYISSMTFDCIYFGGGSPSILDKNDIRNLFKAVFSFFNINKEAEITFEGEARTLSEPDKLDLLKEFNVNRISFGIQTYNDDLRKKLNIVASLKDIERLQKNASERGFQDINVDMLYNLPGQNMGDIEYDLEHLRQSGFDSVDYCTLQYFDINKKMKRDIVKGILLPKPSEEMHISFANQIISGMKDIGYYNVGETVYSKIPKLNKFHKIAWGGGNGNYGAEILAIGAFSKGYINGFTYMNQANVKNYIQCIEDGEFPFETISGQLKDLNNRGAVFFPKFFKLSKRKTSVFETIPEEVRNSWIESGMVYEENEEWKVSERGKIFVPNMMIDACENKQKHLEKLFWAPYDKMESLFKSNVV